MLNIQQLPFRRHVPRPSDFAEAVISFRNQVCSTGIPGQAGYSRSWDGGWASRGLTMTHTPTSIPWRRNAYPRWVSILKNHWSRDRNGMISWIISRNQHQHQSNYRSQAPKNNWDRINLLRSPSKLTTKPSRPSPWWNLILPGIIYI